MARLIHPVFVHKCLDHRRNSIRLVRILGALSSTGLIQCELWHATVEDEHDCLSYVWGPEGGEQEILINGKSFEVRKNLWSFLDLARTKHTASRRTMWIDAICIDQSSNSERIHQVNQMGRIFSGAKEVLAWLGFSDGIERALTFWRDLNARNPQNFHETIAFWHSHIEHQNGELRRYWDELSANHYWTRAWVTQEILLARKFTLVAGTSFVETRRTPGIMALISEISRPQTIRSTYHPRQAFHTYLQARCGGHDIVGSSLISLLHKLPERASTKPRDRIYSLIPIASDAASIIVDYDCSDEQVLLHLFKVFKDSLCPCIIAYMAQALEVEIHDKIFGGSGQNMPLFAYQLKLAIPMTVLGVDLDNYFHNCGSCEAKITGDESELFCTYGRSDCLQGTHLRLRMHRTHNGKKYTIKGEHNHDELEVHSAQAIDPFRMCTGSPKAVTYGYIVYLTAAVIINLIPRLFQLPESNGVLALCSNARNCSGPVAACEEDDIGRTPAPGTCCSSDACWNRVLSADIEKPSDSSQPWVSEECLHQELQYSTWASKPIMRRFFEENGPWVPWAIRNPRSYPVFSDRTQTV